MSKKKINWIWIPFVIVFLIALLFIGAYFYSTQSIFIGTDSVYVANEDRNTNQVYLLQEINPLSDFRIVINSISGTTYDLQGPQLTAKDYTYYYPDTQIGWVGKGACSGLVGTNTFTECCKRLGYIDYRSDTNWNCCYKSESKAPEYLKIYADNVNLIYDWDGTGDFDPQGIDFSDYINTKCNLEFGIDSFESSGRECIIDLTFDTGNGQGVINMGLTYTYKDPTQSTGTIIIEQPEEIVCDGGFELVNGVCEAILEPSNPTDRQVDEYQDLIESGQLTDPETATYQTSDGLLKWILIGAGSLIVFTMFVILMVYLLKTKRRRR